MYVTNERKGKENILCQDLRKGNGTQQNEITHVYVCVTTMKNILINCISIEFIIIDKSVWIYHCRIIGIGDFQYASSLFISTPYMCAHIHT